MIIVHYRSLSLTVQQAEFDQLGVNLQMEAVVAKESMTINWKCEVTHTYRVLACV